MLPHPMRSDADILITRNKQVVVEVKSAISDWGLSEDDFYQWNPKAVKALGQASKAGKVLSAQPVLWLPLCKKPLTDYRNGVLVVTGSAWRLKRAVRKHL